MGDGVRYTRDHEWIRVQDGIGVVGISDYAQEKLGDVVYVELPEVGRTVAQAEEAAVVESVKAASEVYAPASGEVVEVNAALEDDPALVNRDAAGDGWFLKLRLSAPEEVDSLMDEAAYGGYVASLGDD